MPVSDSTSRTLRRVAGLVAGADALLITAGAGMSADSGLPVFRSSERMAQPGWFEAKPRMAWAFYGHRQQLYGRTAPHAGHEILRRWTAALPCGGFVVTSNVDGQFRGAGFADECILEQHGSIHRLQCSVPCSAETWEAPPLDLQIDPDVLQAGGELPRCPRCGAMAAGARARFAATAAAPRVEEAPFDPLPPREMEKLDFVPHAQERPAGVRLEEKLGLALLPPFNLADLYSGTLQTFDAFFLDEFEEETCLAQWFRAQRTYVPLPLIRHYRAEGFMMSGGVLASSELRAGGTWGGACFHIKGPGGEFVSTVCMARRAQEGARLWRHLYESARTPLRPMDYPCEPWIGRRLEPGHTRYPAMLATLFALECAIAVSWMKHQALHESSRRE